MNLNVINLLFLVPIKNNHQNCKYSIGRLCLRLCSVYCFKAFKLRLTVKIGQDINSLKIVKHRQKYLVVGK